MPRTRAAEFLRDRDAEKAHLRKALPQFPVIGLLAVQHHPHRLGRAFLAEKLSRLIAQLLLFVGEIEIHGVTRMCERFSDVVPANARTHNHRPLLLRTASGTGLQRKHRAVWVPAFAGTTAEYAYPGAMRMAPSRRMVSPFSIAFSTM